MNAGGPPPRIFLAGASRAGVSVLRAFCAHGASAAGIWSRSRAPEGVDALLGEHALTVPPCDLLIVGVSDDAIGATAARLAAALPPGERPLAIHLAGGRDRGELAPLEAAGCATASLHPLRSFATPIVDGSALAGVFCAVEAGDDGVAGYLASLAAGAGGRPWRLDGADKAAYHLAASVAGNFVTALTAWSIETLERLGLPESQAREMAVSLARGALAQSARLGPAAALTGPIARGDEVSVARQLAAARDRGREGLFLALARLTLELAGRRGAPAPAELRRLLEEG